MGSFPRSLAIFVAAACLASPARADDLPSPDAMWLGARAVPAALVAGVEDTVEKSIVDQVMGGRVAAADRPVLRARAHAALAPLLAEAFSPEYLAGLGARFLANHYTAGELRELRAREEAPLGQKLRAFERSAAELVVANPEEREAARAALASKTFSDSERKELEAYSTSPLGKKSSALAPDLVGFLVDELDRHWATVRPGIEPRMRNTVEAVIMTSGGK
jgi:hypothetical protein